MNFIALKPAKKPRFGAIGLTGGIIRSGYATAAESGLTRKPRNSKRWPNYTEKRLSEPGRRKSTLLCLHWTLWTEYPAQREKKWVVFLPDCFFIGYATLRNAPDLTIRRYYSYPYNDHFKQTDSVMKFGIVFG